MIDLDSLSTELGHSRLAPVAGSLVAATRAAMSTTRHGDLVRWQSALATLPSTPPLPVILNRSAVTVGDCNSLDGAHQQLLIDALREFIPWRKGPYSVCGIEIDTEWRSDLKWQRLADFIAPLHGRRVLDVGCGSGYHAWRMKGVGAECVLGIDPGALFVMQFKVLQHFIRCPDIWVLPLKLEQMPTALACFDTVFSMGVLYHRREPETHIAELWQALAPGGELVLETLVIPDGDQWVLTPTDRYARMRNVWQIPTRKTLVGWLARGGFKKITVISESLTTCTEQRSTAWMPFESLQDSLHPEQVDTTIEGYPAPRRAIVLALRP